jgi:aldose 1-epimerase
MRKERYGTTQDGQAVDAYTLSNQSGMRVRILNYGCIIASLEVPDRAGRSANVVLGLDTVLGYETLSPHFGAIAGRFANRIAKGRITIDGTSYQLDVNNGPNTLHGGRKSFHKFVWQAEAGQDEAGQDEAGRGEDLVLRHLSPDGDQGFPGNLAIRVRYSLGATNELRIDYEATTDKPTVVNLTNHSYFNLAGEGSGDILGHLVSIEADAITPTDAQQVPTGEIRPVAGTPFDFTTPTAIGARIRMADEQLLLAHGYDLNWVLRKGAGVRPAARAHDPASGRILEVLTDQPGLQLYTGNGLNGALVGPSARAYRQSDGVCFETQAFPDAPNQPHFPSAVLRPGERYRTTTLFRFSTDASD